MTQSARTSSDRSCATLRLDQGIGARIDRARMRRPGNISRNTWITEAILEKLQRDESEGKIVPSFYEFFAGGGMARAGLGTDWQCLFANDFDHKKSRVYKDNWGDKELVTGDVRKVKVADLPGQADLVWGSFPCQDLSLAGGGAGLKGDRSGTFWPFWSLMKGLREDNRAPSLIVLENVNGTLTSHGGKDFIAICNALHQADYRFGALIVDAAHFVPHSRPRLFIIGVRGDVEIPAELIADEPSLPFHTRALRNAFDRLPPRLKNGWIWWSLPAPAGRNTIFADLIEETPTSIPWHTQAETRALLAMMSTVNRAKLLPPKGGAAYGRRHLQAHTLG
ncbi:DNA cytosine methyltransferase [Hankyongella ginsenosidimutans]|uniref:DNA cytosine methyltransferase n=1 Tax=Hankyongella ginsenosidimutans TaxID=1763828 RepID=UPI001FEB70DC|nr:DNA (cytosine-5-)-methyltransferase [Hankyongella ginsenosidimutans]